MARAKIPAWQLFEYTRRKDDTGQWTARSRYNDEAGVRHDIKRSGRTKGAVSFAMRRGVEDAKLRSPRQRELAASSLDAQFAFLEDLGEQAEVEARLAILKAMDRQAIDRL